MLLASWQGWKVENWKLRLIFLKPGSHLLVYLLCADVGGNVCVWYVWGCVCSCVLECIWHAHVCMPVEARGWCGEFFSVTLPPSSSRQGLSQTQSSLTRQVLLASLLWGPFVSGSRITSCHVYLACTWLLGFELPSSQLCGESFLRLRHLSFWDRVSHWILSASFLLGWPATDLRGWGHRHL